MYVYNFVFLLNFKMLPGIVANLLECGIVVSEFELQSRPVIHIHVI